MLPVPLPDVTFHPLTAGGILSLKGSHQIWVLNNTSAFIWRLLGEVGSPEELAEHLRATFPISKERALRDTEAALTLFEREGLLASGRVIQTPEDNDSWDITPHGCRLVEPECWAFRRFFRVANRVIEFRCADAELGEAFGHVLAHLEIEDERQPDTCFSVLSGRDDPSTWDVYIDDVAFKEGLATNMVLPHLSTLLFVRCCEALKGHLLFHSAVVVLGRRAVLFPGEAGSGKTTLAAVLLARGYRVFSDELAVLNTETLCVSPLPLPMSIKLRSMGPLSHHYPDLLSDAVHLRADGKRVRYLSPWHAGQTETADASAQVVLIVFPKYRQGAEDCLIAIDETEAVRRLARTGSSNRDLTHEDVKAMVSLVRSNPCYEVSYGDVDRAVSLLEDHVFGSYLGTA